MEKLQNNVAKNKLQEAIYNISASPECFYALRTNFTKSLATINIVHWLLGIGDRHLENFIIDMSNAQLIGIDFDAAFGYATRKQLVPELLPFRLTKQFVDVMQPMETSGFLEKCMSHLLRTFRNDSDSLMAALEIFIRDPSASNHTRGCKPEYLITTIKNKLNGINPTKPIENDLKIGYLRKFVLLLILIHDMIECIEYLRVCHCEQFFYTYFFNSFQSQRRYCSIHNSFEW